MNEAQLQAQITKIIDEYEISHKGNAQCRCIEGARGHLRTKLFGLFDTLSQKHEGAAIIVVCPKCNYPEDSCKCVSPQELSTLSQHHKAEMSEAVEAERVRIYNYLSGKQEFVTYKNDNGHGVAVPMKFVLSLTDQERNT